MDPARALLVHRPSELTDGVRLFRGAAVDRADWDQLGALDRRRALVLARVAALRTDGVVSHRSAAALWGLPDHGPVDERLHVTDPTLLRTHSGPGTVRHAAPLEPTDVEILHGTTTTSLDRTLVDLIRSVSFTHAVVVLDHVLRLGSTTRARLEGAVGRTPSHRGQVRAREALSFADARSDSPGESISRVTMRALRITTPVLQQRFGGDGREYRVDFWWPDHGVIGEFDGRVKYRSSEDLWAEKRREDALRSSAAVHGFGRWSMREAERPDLLASVLLRAGVPVRRAMGRRG